MGYRVLEKQLPEHPVLYIQHVEKPSAILISSQGQETVRWTFCPIDMVFGFWYIPAHLLCHSAVFFQKLQGLPCAIFPVINGCNVSQQKVQTVVIFLMASGL